MVSIVSDYDGRLAGVHLDKVLGLASVSGCRLSMVDLVVNTFLKEIVG